MRHPVLAGALAAVIVAGGAPDALAVTTVSRAGGTVTVTGGDEINSVRVFRNDGGSSIGDDGGIAAGPGCALVPGRQVATCDASDPVQRIELALGGGADRLTSLDSAEREAPQIPTPPLQADLGPGDDQALGSRADDTLSGGPGRDDLRGGGGADTIDGGPGADELTGDEVARDFSDSGGLPGLLPFGDDRLLARDGEADRILCGLGTDSVVADASDSSAKAGDCERRDGLGKMAVRIGAVKTVRLGALLAGGSLRFRLTCSRACEVGASLLVPKAAARRLGLPGIVDTPIAYRRLTGTGTLEVTLTLFPALRAKLRRAERLSAFIDIAASDAAGVRADPPTRRLVLKR